MTCPYRAKPGDGKLVRNMDGSSVLRRLQQREEGLTAPASTVARRLMRGRRHLPRPVTHLWQQPQHWRVTSALVKVHSRRVTVLEFHPHRPGLLLSGDKFGELCLWRHDATQREVWSPHRYLVSALCFGVRAEDNGVFTGSQDGTVKRVDLTTHDSTPLLSLNPAGWQGRPKDWRMVQSVAGDERCLWVGDDVGLVHVVDPRAGGGGHRVQASFQAHAKGDKVQCLHANPGVPWLMASAGNDKTVRVWDARMLGRAASASAGWGVPGTGAWWAPQPAGGDPTPVLTLQHSRAVSSAFWSPVSGRHLLTTCLDNRIRVWHDVMCSGFPQRSKAQPPPSPAASRASDDAFASPSVHAPVRGGGTPRAVKSGDLSLGEAVPPPSTTLIHSHDFGRYLSPFRAVWDPKDTRERLIACGRYISDSFGGVKLHPVDLLDASGTAGGSGVVAQLVDPIVTTITPVTAISPHEQAIAAGSSMSLFLWKPVSAGKQRADGEGSGEGDDTSATASADRDQATRSPAPSDNTPWWELPEHCLVESPVSKGSRRSGKKGGKKRQRNAAAAFTAAAEAALEAQPPAPEVLLLDGAEGDVQPYSMQAALKKARRATQAKARKAMKTTAAGDSASQRSGASSEPRKTAQKGTKRKRKATDTNASVASSQGMAPASPAPAASAQRRPSGRSKGSTASPPAVLPTSPPSISKSKTSPYFDAQAAADKELPGGAAADLARFAFRGGGDRGRAARQLCRPDAPSSTASTLSTSATLTQPSDSAVAGGRGVLTGTQEVSDSDSEAGDFTGPAAPPPEAPEGTSPYFKK